ncbi:MAG: glycosyltransferase [Candidatus Bathyarchaeota archaeon]|nr:glycosyltransferase [Candidatus Bathyarchaeota archaeon]MDD4326223.1 glycosyltransferase [Candidatus Bathyarchaeota archaeon]
MAVEETPKVTIIVAAYNSQDTIKECLNSIITLDYPSTHLEVIVMDGGSADSTVKIAALFPIKVVSIRLNAPAAYNYAMKIASHPILGFIDADAKVEKDWLKKLVPHLNESNVAGVSGTIETWNNDNLWARSIGYELKTRYSRIGRYTGRIATMNLLLKKEVIENAGGWDEQLPSQYDTDLGFRISAKGYKIAYEPTAVCYHFNRPNLKAFYHQQLQYGKNTLKLYFKHGRLARGDEITDFGMNIQPILLLTSLTLFLLGVVPLLRILWVVSGLILLSMILYFVYSAVKIAIKFNDSTALRLIALYVVRSIAWFVGAVITTIMYLFGRNK